MNIRLLTAQDTKKLEEYLAPHKTECMFICSNMSTAGIEYTGADYQGEYFGYFNHTNIPIEQLQGIIVHYWNGNIMMHTSHHAILERLTGYLKNNIKRPVAGVLGPNMQAESVIQILALPSDCFSINSNEGLYEINLATLDKHTMPSHFDVIPAKDIPKDVLIKWMKNYEIEALSAPDNDDLEKKVEENWSRRLQKNDGWILLSKGTPVSLSAFNARLEDMVQIGPVWTPQEHRNQGFARLLLAHTLHQEQQKGIKKAILFTNNPAAIKAYLAIGFQKIGDYRLALLDQPICKKTPN